MPVSWSPSASPASAENGSDDCWNAAPIAKLARCMQTSSAAVARVCASAPTAHALANESQLVPNRIGPSNCQAIASQASANGSPNANRTKVAPHGPAVSTSCRWNA
jgi:hypothetical protein